MNKDENKSIRSLTISELKALIKECLREILAEEKQFSDVEYKALWLKSPPNPPPIETETMPKPTTYEFYGPPWRYSKPEG